ncbi:MAG: PP2C family protein-serine/threonine phosphatase [Candidatus Eisenbacteria bacterium]|uniref:PP2C family protein-serine/threonine phosphatase n=1 Tax=Eiseniibacteriota bacterium TaxID=2212470 RepID=A0A948WBJ0_UNCEI|nr:PP2C family protein-serine/threonine phosphatase [Candidatus Eisenbacteria bacterium]MBU1949915.1 PP2C family protein-serine/threonine phosphatase [Candidatus Eisenbacteria bacterium]MBU2690008.1 PP2C family protein-serine/threonine phosphatase [Candidatus Eisenbacteria bacterium]
MNVSASLREFAETRRELLADIAHKFGGASGGVYVQDSQGHKTWPKTPVAIGEGIRIPIGSYGSLHLTSADGKTSQESAEEITKLIGSLLEGWFESEMELNQLVDEHVSTTNQLIALYNITRGTRETWDLADKLRVIVEEAGRQTNCRQAVLEVTLDDIPEHFFWTTDGHVHQTNISSILKQARQRDEAHICQSGSQYVAAPVLVRDKPTGWLIADRRHGENPYQARELKIIQALADLAAGFVLTNGLQAKVINNLRIAKELEIASQIGEMLIPKQLPDILGIDLGAVCFQATEVGGDFYTVQKLGDDCLAFSLGDVTGKGVPAALLMSMTRTVYQTLSYTGSTPAEALTILNQALYEDLTRVEKFVTMVVGRYNPSTGEIHLANAGHSPVFHLPAGEKEPRLLEPSSPPLGVLPEITVNSEILQLTPGSILALASDGFHEMRNDEGELFGVENLGKALAAAAGLKAESIVTRLLNTVRDYSGGMSQWDDQTLLILKAKQQA